MVLTGDVHVLIGLPAKANVTPVNVCRLSWDVLEQRARAGRIQVSRLCGTVGIDGFSCMELGASRSREPRACSQVWKSRARRKELEKRDRRALEPTVTDQVVCDCRAVGLSRRLGGGRCMGEAWIQHDVRS